MRARRSRTSSRQPANTTSCRARASSGGPIASALSKSVSPTARKQTSGRRRRMSRAAANSSRHPFSATSRPTVPTTSASSAIPSSVSQRRQAPPVDGRAGSNSPRSTPLPSRARFARGHQRRSGEPTRGPRRSGRARDRRIGAASRSIASTGAACLAGGPRGSRRGRGRCSPRTGPRPAGRRRGPGRRAWGCGCGRCRSARAAGCATSSRNARTSARGSHARVTLRPWDVADPFGLEPRAPPARGADRRHLEPRVPDRLELSEQ